MATSLAIISSRLRYQREIAYYTPYARHIAHAGRQEQVHPTAPASRFHLASILSVQTDFSPAFGHVDHLEIEIPHGSIYRNDRTRGAFPCAVLAYQGLFFIPPNECKRTSIFKFPTVDRAALASFLMDFPPVMDPNQMYIYIPPVDWTKPIAAELEIDEDTVPPTVPIPAPVDAIPEGVRGPVRHVRRALRPTEPTRLMTRRPVPNRKYL